MPELFVLTHQYSDLSGFKVIGITDSQKVAEAWILGGEATGSSETHAYIATLRNDQHFDLKGLPELIINA